MINAQDIIARRSSQAPLPAGSKLLVGESARFRQVLALLARCAAVDINVLILGETGTGKELAARAIHDMSARRAEPFVAVDCAVLSETLIEAEIFGHERGAFTGAVAAQQGLFELAQGGSLFLDEIGNIPLSLQAKLLRVLQERRIYRVGGREAVALNARFIAATNVDLAEAIRGGRFRADLYYRLNEVTLRLPPLRERPDDIPLLARYYAEVYGQRFTPSASPPLLSPEVMEILRQHAWPGNVRELENAMKAAVAVSQGEGELLPEHLPVEIVAARPLVRAALSPRGADAGLEGEALHVSFALDLRAGITDLKTVGMVAAAQAERELLRSLLARQRLSSGQLARLLNVDPKTLRSKLRKYQLEDSVALS